MIEQAQKDLFGGAQIAGDDLRTFARESVRKKTNPLNPRDLRKGRAKPLHEIARICAQRNPLGSGEGVTGDIEDARLEERQLVRALTEINSELTALNVELAPWWAMMRAAGEWHAEAIAEAGFQLGGEQARQRREWVSRLDTMRASLADVFKATGEARSRARGIEAKLRNVRFDIKSFERKGNKRAR